MTDTDFRARVLTLLGAVGYLVALLMMLINILPTYTVPTESILLTLATSSALLGIDYGIDIFKILPARQTAERPEKPSRGTTDDATNETGNTGNDKA